MRSADRIVAAALFLLGIGVAWKATELPIGVLPKEGPGGGFLPFWLSLGISAVAAVVFVQTYARRPAAGQADEEQTFITREGVVELLRVGIPGFLMILFIDILSVYVSAAAFVFYTLHFVGRHRLRTSLAVTIGVPVAVYIVFEKFLIIPLPKGYLEYLFYWS